MCVGFGNLAMQGFLALCPVRDPRRGERETALNPRKRTPKAGIFDTLRTIRMFWGVAAVPLFRGGPDIERIAFPLPVRHGSSV